MAGFRPSPKLAAYGICLSLTACSTNSQQLRADSREKDTVFVDLPYATVYSNVAQNAQRCFHGGTNASYYYAEARQVVPGRSATVEVIHGGVATTVLLSADVLSRPNGTEINYFVHRKLYSIFTSGDVKFRPVMLGWAKGPSDQCS